MNQKTITEQAKFGRELDALLTSIRQKAVAQFEYSIKENIPRGILKIEECANHAINHGIVAAMSARNQWDVDATVKLAIDILEDSNCHAEVRVLNTALPKLAKEREELLEKVISQCNSTK